MKRCCKTRRTTQTDNCWTLNLLPIHPTHHFQPPPEIRQSVASVQPVQADSRYTPPHRANHGTNHNADHANPVNQKALHPRHFLHDRCTARIPAHHQSPPALDPPHTSTYRKTHTPYPRHPPDPPPPPLPLLAHKSQTPLKNAAPASPDTRSTFQKTAAYAAASQEYQTEYVV